jgi:hypothetical protein
LKFNSGILTEVFNFLKIKVESFNEIQKDCVLVLDELAITPGKYYDTSMNMYFGDVTLPLHAGIATHVLVFMLAGINSRWKQMVAYYFTGNSVSGSVFQNIINSIFEKAAELKLNIISITSDMGACNQALWKKMQVGAGRHKVIKNYISNPTDSTKTVFFFYVLKTSEVSGFAAEMACKRKHNKYRSIISSNYIFKGLAFETLGPWCKETIDFINVIGDRLIAESPDSKSKKFLFERISLAIQRGNAASIRGTFPDSALLSEIFAL